MDIQINVPTLYDTSTLQEHVCLLMTACLCAHMHLMEARGPCQMSSLSPLDKPSHSSGTVASKALGSCLHLPGAGITGMHTECSVSMVLGSDSSDNAKT